MLAFIRKGELIYMNSIKQYIIKNKELASCKAFAMQTMLAIFMIIALIQGDNASNLLGIYFAGNFAESCFQYIKERNKKDLIFSIANFICILLTIFLSISL